MTDPKYTQSNEDAIKILTGQISTPDTNQSQNRGFGLIKLERNEPNLTTDTTNTNIENAKSILNSNQSTPNSNSNPKVKSISEANQKTSNKR
jgi:hypothetical protein